MGFFSLLLLRMQMVWMIPSESEHKIMWDSAMCANSSAGAEVRRLLVKATKGALLPNQCAQIVNQLKSDPKLIYHVGLSPQKVPYVLCFFFHSRKERMWPVFCFFFHSRKELM